MITTGANFELEELDRAIADVETRAKRLAPAFRELRRPLRQDQRAHARSAQSPEGSWPPRSPMTEARRTARNRRIRATKTGSTSVPSKFKRRSAPKRLLGRLPGALIVVAGELFLRATSRVPWAGVHQYGGHAGHNNRVEIPRRPFLWLSDKLLETAQQVLGDYVVKGWKR